MTCRSRSGSASSYERCPRRRGRRVSSAACSGSGWWRPRVEYREKIGRMYADTLQPHRGQWNENRARHGESMKNRQAAAVRRARRLLRPCGCWSPGEAPRNDTARGSHTEPPSFRGRSSRLPPAGPPGRRPSRFRIRSSSENRQRVDWRSSSAFNRQRRERQRELVSVQLSRRGDRLLEIQTLHDVDADPVEDRDVDRVAHPLPTRPRIPVDVEVVADEGRQQLVHPGIVSA